MFNQEKAKTTAIETTTTTMMKRMRDEENAETTTSETMATTEEQECFVETSRADKIIWLLKCPRMAFETLNHYNSSSSPVVGKVVVSVDPCNPSIDASASQFTMELASTEADVIPRRYRIDMSDAQVPMTVFSESSKGIVSVEGNIMNKMDMKPHEDSLDSYGKLCRERTKRYKTKTRQIQVIGDDNGARMRPMPGTFNLRKKEPTNKGFFSRRARRDRREVEEILFQMFERQPNWSFKQLTQETDQPELYLKEIIKDVCDYNSRGDNQGTYSLKPEYRLANNEADIVKPESQEEEAKASQFSTSFH